MSEKDPWYRGESAMFLYRMFLGITTAVSTVIVGAMVQAVWSLNTSLATISGRIDGLVIIVGTHEKRIDKIDDRLAFVERRERH